MPSSIFQRHSQSSRSMARTGVVTLAHGSVQTPAFMPIATLGSVKTLTTWDLQRLGFEIILGNTYHLWRHPGMQIIGPAGGLHTFMHWSKPLLTDSGGFQAWSLSKTCHFTEEGVWFRSESDGLQHFLSPEKSIQIQSVLGSDITLALDQVVNAQADRPTAKQAMERTFRWAQRCRQEFTRLHQSNLRIDLGNLDAPWLPQPQPNKYGEIDHQQLAKYERAKTRWHLHTSQPFSPQTDLSSKNSNSKVIFGIPQGAQYKDLRRESARQIKALDFPGYSIGGVAQGGEPAEVMYDQVQTQTEILEDQKPRHLLGVGTPEDIIATVRRGVDMFDCVYPTRNARHGTLFFWTDHERLAYETVKIRSRCFHKDFTPINPESTLPELRTYTKAYLSHLVQTGEALASYLATLHNLEFYQQLMRQIREKIRVGEL